MAITSEMEIKDRGWGWKIKEIMVEGGHKIKEKMILCIIIIYKKNPNKGLVA
jgi:hypothetical protein